jgi:arsenate reductase (thioredoxin)
MTDRRYNVLFLCTHNSARSIIAECVMNKIGAAKFKAYSAGSQPSGKIHPFALELLDRLRYDTGGLRSKSWEEFAHPGAPQLNFVFTVCDGAANEVCPVWPGQPMSAHWGLPDPSKAQGNESERRYAFADTHRMLYQRISVFTNLPFKSLDALSLQRRLDDIGRSCRRRIESHGPTVLAPTSG